MSEKCPVLEPERERELRALYDVVPLDVDHLDGVLAIERESYTNPWRRRAFEHEIERNPLAWSRVALFPRAGIGEPRVVAYVVTWIVFEHLHVQNVAVHPEHRRRGLARFLLAEAMEEAIRRGAETVLLEVRRSNVEAQELYRKLGFRELGVRKDYYSVPREDAIVLQRELPLPPVPNVPPTVRR